MISLREGPTRLQLSGDGREIKALAKKLRYHPKGYFFSPKFKAYQLTDGREGWDGYICPLRFLHEDGTLADCLRGHKDPIITIARELGFTVSQRDCLKSPFADLLPDDLPDDLIAADFKLDQYQREAIVHWLRNGMGVNRLPVNSGKTALICAAIAMIKRHFGDDGRILYITPSERLVRQAHRDARGFLPGYDITQYGGGKHDATGKDLVISTVAMLWKHHTDLKKNGFLDSFIAVCYDESHHVCSPSSFKLMMLLPCFFRFGCSDTKKESDPEAAAKIQGLLGPTRFDVPVSKYIDIGRSARPSIYIVEKKDWYDRYDGLPHQADPGTTAWALVGGEWRRGTYLGPVYERDEEGRVKTVIKKELAGAVSNEVYTGADTSETVKTANWVEVKKPITMEGYHQIQFDGDPEPCEVQSTYCLLERVTDRAIIRFRERNQLITDWARYYSQEKHFPTLVVCTRTLHIYILQAMIGKAIGEDKVQILLGDHTSKERDRAFEWFKHTRGGVLISPLVKEGVSIPELRAGVVADAIAGWEVASQIIGRFIRRKKEDNTAHIVWFHDQQHCSLRRGSQEVLHKLMDIRGYTFLYPLAGPDTLAQAKVYKNLAD